MFPSIGIDVHKATLFIATSDGAEWIVSRDAAGMRSLIDRIRHQCAIVVMEPSGGFERVVLAACWDADIPVALVNPFQVRAFAQGTGQWAKTDQLDARMLARFATTHHPIPLRKPELVRLQIRDLVRTRRQFTAMRVRLEQQHAIADPVVADVFAQTLVTITAQIRTLTTRIDALIASSSSAQRAHQIFMSVPGIGDVSAAMLVAEMPELGTCSNKQIASLLGVAPVTQQSGTARPVGHIRNGRHDVRAALWMPVLAMQRYNPVIRAMALRLKGAGKPGKIVVTACMRKLITILNTLILKDEAWDPGRYMA